MKSLKALLVAALLSITAACGGGGGDTPAASNTVAGVAAAGIIKGGTVKVFAPYSSATGADKVQIGPDATTDTVTGAYSVNLGSYTGPVVVEVTGGTYTDEATGQTGVVLATPLRAVAVSSTGTVNVAVTPLTELATRQAAALAGTLKVNEAAINQANAQISDLFKVADIVATQPLDASASIAGGTQAQQNYTLALAALSQLAGDPAQLASSLSTVAGAISTGGVMEQTVASNISTSLTTFVASGNNNTGVSTVPDTLANVGATTKTLTLVLAGSGVKGVETDIVFPTGVSVATESNGAVKAAALTNLIGGTDRILLGSSLSAGSMRIEFTGSEVMPAGDIATVKLQVAPGVAAPAASAFTLQSTSLFASGGVPATGATLTLR